MVRTIKIVLGNRSEDASTSGVRDLNLSLVAKTVASKTDWIDYCKAQGFDPLDEAKRQELLGHRGPIDLMKKDE